MEDKKSNNFWDKLSLASQQNECCSKPKKTDVVNSAEKVHENQVIEEGNSRNQTVVAKFKLIK